MEAECEGLRLADYQLRTKALQTLLPGAFPTDICSPLGTLISVPTVSD